MSSDFTDDKQIDSVFSDFSTETSSASVNGIYPDKPSDNNLNTQQPYKLSLKSLDQLPNTVKHPPYDPASITPGILHIGTGNFALAHLASYVHDLLVHDQRWGIIATSIKSGKIIQALRKQSGMYVLVVREKQNKFASILAPVVETIYGAEDPKTLIARIAEVNVKMITVTVTNKGYYLAHGGKLNVLHPDIAHDLVEPNQPKSVYGYLAVGLNLRRCTVNKPMTIISLDNIEQNSSTMKTVFFEFLQLTNPDLITWVSDNVDFSTSLVDRITPEPTEAFRKDTHSEIGFESSLTIGCESFRQLVVERGRFENTMPSWNKVGVQVVECCAEYWQRKFYCLNAGHFIVAICGQRLDYDYIHETMCRPAIACLLTRAQKEWCTFLSGTPDELEKYCESIRIRFSDASLNDTVCLVAARGTSKISDRLLTSVERAMAANGNIICIPAFTIAIWLLNLSRTNESGGKFKVDDDDFQKVLPVYESSANLLATTPKESTQLDLDSTRTILHSLASILSEQRFTRLAGVETFVRGFAWSLLVIYRTGLESAVVALLNHQWSIGA